MDARRALPKRDEGDGRAVRNILLLLVGVIGLAILRNLIREVSRLVMRAMGSAQAGGRAASSNSNEQVHRGGKLVRDPNTGTYVDPAHAVRAEVEGTVLFFESEASRDAYLRTKA